MIIGWYFMVSNQVINSDSNYKFMKSVIEGIIKNDKDKKIVFVVFLPYSKNIKYINDGFFEKYGDRIKVVLLQSPSRKILQARFFNSEFIYQTARRFGINIFFNNVPEVSIMFRNLLSTVIEDTEPLVVTYNHYTIHPSLPYSMEGYLPLRVLEIIGNIYSQIVFFNTKYHLSMFLDNIEELGYNNFKEEILGKTEIIPIPVLDSELGKYYKEDANFEFRDGFVFYYNHRLQAYKNWRKTFGILKEFWQKYKNFKLFVSYASGDNTQKILSEFPFIHVKHTFTHDEYYKSLTQPHFNILDSFHETFCISIVESALLGGIPIVNNKTTMPELFPDNYEFMFKNSKELREILDKVLSGYYDLDYLNKTKKDLIRHFAKYNSFDIGKKIRDRLYSNHVSILEREKERIKNWEKLQNFLDMFRDKEVLFRDLWNKAKKHLGLGEQALTSWRFSRLIDLIDNEKYFKNGELYIKFR